MINKNKILVLSLVILISIIGVFSIIYILINKEKGPIVTEYTIAVHSSIETEFKPFLEEIKIVVGEKIEQKNFTTNSELELLLENAEKNKLLAVITPIANDVANIELLTSEKLISTLPKKNTETNTFAALQRSLKNNNILHALAIAYNPYVVLKNKEHIEKDTFAPFYIAGNTNELKLATSVFVNSILQEDNTLETLKLAQKDNVIQKNPINFSLDDCYSVFKEQLTEQILISFSYLYDIPKIDLQLYSMIQTSPFFGTIQGVLFPSYIEENFENNESVYTKVFDFFANPEFQYRFADSQNYLPARIDSEQRNAYSDAMRTFLLQEGKFINIETQYTNEDEKKELLSIMTEALSTAEIN